MRTAPTCVAIFGMATAAFAGGNVLMDQIGPNDGSGIDTSNMLANQYFEASFSSYDIGCVDDFDNSAGLAGASMQIVIGGWNGYTGIAGVSGLQVNFYDDYVDAGNDLAGYTSETFMGTPTPDPNWGLAGYDLVGVYATAGWVINPGTAYTAMIPFNEFGTNGQTGAAIGFDGNLQSWQCNPNGGFGFGPYQEMPNNIALRVLGGSGDPCEVPLDLDCPADVSGPTGGPDGYVSVDDVLTVIATYGQSGDGSFRPQGDCYPLPNGDCQVNVDDLLQVINAYGMICLDLGACCYESGSCTGDLTEITCVDAGGSWLGANSTCDDCISGACCLGDGGCQTLTTNACFTADGHFLGADTLCGDCPALPANNDCSGAEVITGGTYSIDNTAATTSGDMIDPCGVDGPPRQLYQDVYYSLTAAEDGQLIVSTCNATTLDTVIAVYDSCSGSVLACNDDGTDCADYTSHLELEASAGESFIIRIGSYAYGETGVFDTIIMVQPETPGACCVNNLDCYDDLTPTDCKLFGGVYQGADSTCSDADCGWAGCQSGDTPEGVPCQEDTDAAGANADPNGGLNVNPPAYGSISVDETICGSASTFTCLGCSSDGADAAYRDTDWYLFDNPDGGEYTLTVGGEGPLLAGFVDLNQGAFVDYFYTTALEDGSITVILPAGNDYAVWVGHDTNAGYDTPCNTLQDLYTARLQGAPAPDAACCADGVCLGDMSPADCANAGGAYTADESCAAGYQCPVDYEGCSGFTGQGPLDPSAAWTAGSSDATYGYIRYANTSASHMAAMRVWGLTLAYNGGWGVCADPDMTLAIGAYVDNGSGLPGSAIAEASVLPTQMVVNLTYGGVYPLHRFDVDLFAEGNIRWVKAASESDGLGDCWLLWMSSTEAGSGTSAFDNLGTVTLEDFGLAHCLYE